ncbi:MAG: hypothetical protein K9G37_12010 [Crocinitomicaceae bacterium]|nr:hypothetical protein [Crocinitomicaceae bacterium]
MKIVKTNGKIASKKIHLLADVVMETSLNNSWMLNGTMKIEILISAEGSPWEISDLEEMCEVCLNHTLAVYFALKTWYSGYYGDVKVDFDSIQDYFIGWGESDEI